nr:hypothetical protein [Tanacetum cinerariifolium]
MAKSSSSSENETCCSKSCRKNTEDLNTKITKLSEALSDSLSQVEDRLVEFKTQEIKFCKKIRGLEFKVESINKRIENLLNELEKVKKEKEGLDSKLTGFESTEKDLDTLLGTQKTDKNKEGLRYSVVPPPAQVYSPLKKDISWTGLPEFAHDTITDYSRSSPSIEKKGKNWPRKNITYKNVTPIADFFKIASVSAARRVNTTAPRPDVNSTRPKTTQDLVIIKLIQRVKRLKRELKSRTSFTEIQKGNSGTKLEDSLRTKRSRGTKSKEVVDYILQVKIKLLIKKLKDLEAKYQV